MPSNSSNEGQVVVEEEGNVAGEEVGRIRLIHS